LLSEVATRLSLYPVFGTGSEVKTNESEKSYKKNWTLDLKHRGGDGCGKEEWTRAGSRKQEAGCRKQEAGCRMQEAGCRMQEAGCRT